MYYSRGGASLVVAAVLGVQVVVVDIGEIRPERALPFREPLLIRTIVGSAFADVGVVVVAVAVAVVTVAVACRRGGWTELMNGAKITTRSVG